jgi:thiol-disulfide isomerase/thioredoxin
MNPPQRIISRNRYFIAAVITILIFLLGMALGAIIDSKRLDYLSQETKQIEIDYKSLQLQSMLMSDMKNNNNTCALIKTALDNSIQTLHESLDRIQNYQKDTKINQDEYELIARRYAQDNIQYWQFAKKAKEQCDMNIVSILYFFSTNYCPSCPDQGVILTYFKKIFGDNLLVFPIDIDLAGKELAIRLMEANYNINETPSIVVEDTAFKGNVVQKDDLYSIICSHFNKQNPECAGIAFQSSVNLNGETNANEAEKTKQAVFIS